MESRKDSILFDKINAIATVNKEIIARIEEKKVQNIDVITGYSYSVSIGNGDILALSQLKDQIHLTESKKSEKGVILSLSV